MRRACIEIVKQRYSCLCELSEVLLLSLAAITLRTKSDFLKSVNPAGPAWINSWIVHCGRCMDDPIYENVVGVFPVNQPARSCVQWGIGLVRRKMMRKRGMFFCKFETKQAAIFEPR